MDHYTKTSTVAAESEEKKEPCEINVKSGSKIRNIVAQAYRMLQVGFIYVKHVKIKHLNEVSAKE